MELLTETESQESLVRRINMEFNAELHAQLNTLETITERMTWSQ